MGRFVTDAPALWTLNMGFIFNDQVDFGLEYNLNSGLGGTLMLGRNNGIAVGYAYTRAQQNDLRQLSQGTHEAVLRIKLGHNSLPMDPEALETDPNTTTVLTGKEKRLNKRKERQIGSKKNRTTSINRNN